MQDDTGTDVSKYVICFIDFFYKTSWTVGKFNLYFMQVVMPLSLFSLQHHSMPFVTSVRRCGHLSAPCFYFYTVLCCVVHWSFEWHLPLFAHILQCIFHISICIRRSIHKYSSQPEWIVMWIYSFLADELENLNSKMGFGECAWVE